MITRRSLLTSLPASAIASSLWAANDLPIGFIFVGASWCPHCKRAAPVLAAIAQNHALPVIVASHDQRPIPPFADVVDATTHPLSAAHLRLPTTLIYSQPHDDVLFQVVGYGTARKYAARITSGVGQVLRFGRAADQGAGATPLAGVSDARARP